MFLLSTNLNIIHLAQCAPNIFWNLVLRYESDSASIFHLIQPNAENGSRRCIRVRRSQSSFQYVRENRCSSISSQSLQENRKLLRRASNTSSNSATHSPHPM